MLNMSARLFFYVVQLNSVLRIPDFLHLNER
ncbi:hypothetical protein J2S09_005249 [Bacillus fengqiuensis]|nr:hypothetical protein [Bacillus fengqiuensis]